MTRRPHRSTLFPYTTLFRSTSSSSSEPDRDLPGHGHHAKGLESTAQDLLLADLAERDLVDAGELGPRARRRAELDRKSTRLNSSHVEISYAVFCLKKKKNT